LASLVNPHVRVAAGQALIADVAQQVPARVLWPEIAKMEADAEERQGRTLRTPLTDRQAAQQSEPAPIENLPKDSAQSRGQRREREIPSPHGRWLQARLLDPSDGRLDLRDLLDRVNPVGRFGNLRTIPRRGSRDRVRQLE